MQLKQKSIVAAVVAGVMLIASVSLAIPAFMKTFMEMYKISSTSTLGKAQCAICHPAKNKTGTLNPYGQDLQKAMKAAKTKVLTKSILQKAEGLDSDKDGFCNIAEIKADTLPGDPKSHH